MKDSHGCLTIRRLSNVVLKLQLTLIKQFAMAPFSSLRRLLRSFLPISGLIGVELILIWIPSSITTIDVSSAVSPSLLSATLELVANTAFVQRIGVEINRAGGCHPTAPPIASSTIALQRQNIVVELSSDETSELKRILLYEKHARSCFS